eukprot:snap_masked-scaffold_9-processed-gene-0.15-mRNA-1 protein AED:1.00 eAED:1.00 QI:0/-1/0/0/-1/1/1/0/193
MTSYNEAFESYELVLNSFVEAKWLDDEQQKIYVLYEVLRAYLVIFMTMVGFMKFAGFLRHENSRLVGFLELISGALFLPSWKAVRVIFRVSENEGANDYLNNDEYGEKLILVGCYLIMTALGIVTGDPKKIYSPVCWVHAILCCLLGTWFGLIYDRPVVDIGEAEVPLVAVLLLFMVQGHIFARLMPHSSSQK